MIPEFSFCETIAAVGRWHIRQLTEKGRMLGGGADTETLCGLKAAWDLAVPINAFHLNQAACVCCAKAYIEGSIPCPTTSRG